MKNFFKDFLALYAMLLKMLCGFLVLLASCKILYPAEYERVFVSLFFALLFVTLSISIAIALGDFVCEKVTGKKYILSKLITQNRQVIKKQKENKENELAELNTLTPPATGKKPRDLRKSK